MAWSFSDEKRAALTTRTSLNLFSIAFAAKKAVPEKDVLQITSRLEKEAYASAQAQSSTTTGSRPLEETTKIYLRKLAELVVEFVKGHENEVPVGGNGAVDEGVLDLTSTARGFLSKEHAEQLFAPLLIDGARTHTVMLGTKSFGVEAVEVAYKALSNVNRTLKYANLSDIISGRPEQEALAVLEKFSQALSTAQLKQLDLSNNALGEKGLRACQALFKSQAQLKRLSLHNIGCSPNACIALDELTNEMSLDGLLLSNNMSGDEGSKAIVALLARMSNIQYFQMASSRVGPDGMACLIDGGLSKAHKLQSLDVHDNPLTAEVIPRIANLLGRQYHLTHLNLSDTCLTDEGVIALSKALVSTVPNIEKLGLALNEMTFQGAQHLSRALVTKTKLRELDLHENELEDHGGVIIAKALASLKTLEVIDVSGNMLRRFSVANFAKAMEGKHQFKHLDISDNQISLTGIEEVQETIRRLCGSGVQISIEENEEEGEDETIDIDMDADDLETLIEKLSALIVHD